VPVEAIGRGQVDYVETAAGDLDEAAVRRVARLDDGGGDGCRDGAKKDKAR
jgi:hypothetical protein